MTKFIVTSKTKVIAIFSYDRAILYIDILLYCVLHTPRSCRPRRSRIIRDVPLMRITHSSRSKCNKRKHAMNLNRRMFLLTFSWTCKSFYYVREWVTFLCKFVTHAILTMKTCWMPLIQQIQFLYCFSMEMIDTYTKQ